MTARGSRKSAFVPCLVLRTAVVADTGYGGVAADAYGIPDGVAADGYGGKDS
jgi:hypothetical protein